MKVDKPWLMLGDCLEMMQEIPEGSVDMICADLPYQITRCSWDALIPFAPLWSEYKRVIKRNGAVVLTASQPFTSALVMSNPDWFRYTWIWQKTQARGHLNAYRMPMKKHEDVCVFYQNQPTYNPQIVNKSTDCIRPHSRSGQTENYGPYNGDQEENRKIPLDKKLPDSILLFPNPQRTVHPTQKPVALMEYLIRTYTNEGETVLDNCFGSASTGIACQNTSRKFIGIERDSGYFQIGVDRMHKNAEALRGDLFKLAAE